MKCPYCGADVKRGQTRCQYCDSEILPPPQRGTDPAQRRQQARENNQKEMIRTTGKTVTAIVVALIVAFAVVAIVMLVISLLFLSSDRFHEMASSYTGTDSFKNQTEISVTILDYQEDGTVSLTYHGSERDNVKILDRELVNWLNETGRTLDRVAVLADTDADGNIARIAMESEPFVILAKDENTYLACRGEQILQFTSDTTLKLDRLYTGYFTYPDLQLVNAKEEAVFAGTLFDSTCEGKQTVTEKTAYSEQSVTLYQLYYHRQWYYCSREIYDSVEEGDSLDDFITMDIPSCIMYP